MSVPEETQVVVVGAGFTGLTAAYELVKLGVRVTVLEADSDVGGLAGAFEVGGTKLERFYHHWFTNDKDVTSLITELELSDRIEVKQTRTGVYYANNFFKLSTPLDLLKFTPLRFSDRVRLGLLTLRARHVKDWMLLEHKTASEWLRELGGESVYQVMWLPLLRGKFGPYAEHVSAVWFWNKLKLRGSSRGKTGEERLAYFRGGFITLAHALANRIRSLGGHIELNACVSCVEPTGDKWKTTTQQGIVTSQQVIATPALPLIADMVRNWASVNYIQSLERIQYLCNVCLVLELDRSLSETYWLNVNDPNFPFVGVIEHTNFQHPEVYTGKHVVYLSKYLPHTDQRYRMNSQQFMDYAYPFLKEMFPDFQRNWIQACHLWRARWAQPVVEKYYSKIIPAADGPKKGLHICSMAQIYPEDRGTNYAIREGRKIAARIALTQLQP